jgi:predicted permease
VNWLSRLVRRSKMEQQLEKELRFHIDEHASELIATGVDPAEARRRARLAIGGPEQVKEECHDARGTRWLEDLWADMCLALRAVRQQPAFAAVAVLTLALGIGATTVMFSLVSGVLLKPLPYSEPDRLVSVNGHTDTWNTKVNGEQKLAYLDFLDCKRAAHSLDMAAMVYNSGTLSRPAPPEYVDYFEISPELFSVMRTPLGLGRAFLPEDDHIGAAPVAILGYTFWQRRFAARSDILGSSVVLDNKSYIVVGVAPQGFRLYGDEPEVYTPLGEDAAGYLHNRAAQPVRVVARLRPGATLAQAQAELVLTGQQLSQAFADTNGGRSFRVKPLRRNVGDTRYTLWLLFGAVSLILLISCANVASLLLARAVSRERELAMRVALGATRGRLVRQCLTESSLLGLSGGLAGVFLAANGLRPFLSFWPGDLPRAEEIQMDWRVLLFTVAVSLLSGVFFGLAPALRAPLRDLEPILRSGARSIARSSRQLHSTFVVSEVALAIVLLVAAGMLGRTLLRTSSLNPGLQVHNLLVARMALSPAVLADSSRIPAAWQDIIDRAHRVAGVQAVTAVDIVPMRSGNNQIGYWPTADVPPQNRQPLVLASSATPEYLKVMGIPLIEGRFFNDHDRMDSEQVIVIDEVLAKGAFAGQNAVGKNLWIPEMPCAQPLNAYAECKGPYKVVGVVGHVRYWGLAGDDQAEVRAQLYYPLAQVAPHFLPRWSQLMSIAVRTDVPPLTLLESLRQQLRGAAGDQVLYQVRTMEQLQHSSLDEQRFLLLLFSIFAGLALLLACVGIYGVLAYLTGQRVPEMGLRIALGASPTSVQWLVLRQSLTMIVLGVVIGGSAALAAARVLIRTVEGMRSEPTAFALVIPVLILAALLASWLPALRASRIDPIVALRHD